MAVLRLYRWRYVHQRPAQTARGWRTPLEGCAGFPDICAIRGTRLLFIELKSGTGRLNVEQDQWRLQLLAVGPPVEYHLWTKKHLEDGSVQAVLR